MMVSGIVSSFLAVTVFAAIFGRNRLNLAEMGVELLAAYLLFESAVLLIIMLMLMKARGETFSMLGLHLRRWKIHALLGILAAPCLIIISAFIGLFFRLFLPQYALEKNPLMEMINSPQQLTLFITATIIAGGIKEELQRAFILRRFSLHLGGAVVGLIIWSLAFGAGHYAQGVQGIYAATILGFIFGVLYLVRGNLVLPITAHSAYNTLTLLIYWFTIGINK